MKHYAQYYSPGQDIRFTMTTPEEETALWVRVREKGDEAAREFLIRNHLLFAMQEAQSQVQGKLDNDEIVSAANYAVMLAFQKFDHTKGHRFTTYLRFFIKGEVASLWRSKFVGGTMVPSAARNSFTNRDSRTEDGVGGWGNGGDISRRLEEIGNIDLSVDHPGEVDDARRFHRAALNKVLPQLSERDQKFLNEIYVNEKSFANLGRERNISREAVRASHERLMKRLRTLMRAEGLTADEVCFAE